MNLPTEEHNHPATGPGTDRTQPVVQNAARQKRKRQILLTFAILLGALLVLYGVSLLLEGIAPESETEPPAPTYTFREADWEENIFENEDYLSLDRTVYYSPYGIGAGETVSVDERSIVSYGEQAVLMYRLVNAIILGDAEAYNSFFTRSYLEENGAQPAFTMQMLYDIKINYTEAGIDEESDTRQAVYRLEYKICGNNGTYRADMGSDVSRAQYFFLAETDDGYRVDRVLTTGS